MDVSIYCTSHTVFVDHSCYKSIVPLPQAAVGPCTALQSLTHTLSHPWHNPPSPASRHLGRIPTGEIVQLSSLTFDYFSVDDASVVMHHWRISTTNKLLDHAWLWRSQLISLSAHFSNAKCIDVLEHLQVFLQLANPFRVQCYSGEDQMIFSGFGLLNGYNGVFPCFLSQADYFYHKAINGLPIFVLSGDTWGSDSDFNVLFTLWKLSL